MLPRKSLVALCALLFLTACETDDVVAPPGLDGPMVTLAINPFVISENGGESTITATLSETSDSQVIVNLSFTGTAVENEDYTLSGQSITVGAGEITGTATLSAIDNDEEDGNKSVVIRIASIDGGYSEDNQEQILTIEDDETTPSFQLIINEVLYDPPPGIDGDANGDGVRDPQEDQFIEFINLSATELDLTGYKIFDATAWDNDEPRHVFPDGSTVPPGKCMLVFAGGVPTGDFGGSVVQITSSGQLNMNNNGDFMRITDPDNQVLLTFDIEPLSNNPDESYTRSPDITGDEFVQHNSVAPTLYSPGTRLDGTNF